MIRKRGNKTKGQISKGVLEENKQSTLNFSKNTCAYQWVRNVRFSENLACSGFLETPVLRFALLSYYRRIMLRTRLRNIFLKTKTEDNEVRCAKQINLCVTLLRKSKRIILIALTRKTFATIKSFGKYLSHYYH